MSTNFTNGEANRDHESLITPLLSSQRSLVNSTSQVAIVGAHVCPIESLDYEIAENDFFKQDWRSRGKMQIFQYVLMKWLLCFLIGLIVSLIGFFNNLAVENIAGMKFVVTSNMMMLNKFGMAFLVFSVSNLILTLAYLNGVDAPGIFSLRTLVIKIIGSITAVSSSLLVGKAGPMVHTGACVAALLGQGGSKRFKLTWRWLRFFKNDRDRRDLVTCGSAAGMAAAFRAPVGGVLFALEEMASWWRSALLWRSFFTTAVVAIVLRALIDFCLSGKCGLFGKGGLIMFDVYSESVTYHLIDVLPVLTLGAIGGILGSLYNFLLDKVLRIYSRINEKGVALQNFTCLCNFHFHFLSSFWTTMACLIKNTNFEFQYPSILIFFVTCYFLSIISFGIVAPAGLFIPVIVTGASYGRFVGMLVGSHSNLDHGLYAVLGAASFLAGSMRMTVSLCVIILELTNNLLLLPLIMLVLLVSKTVADAFNSNIYDLIMNAKGFPYLETHTEPYMRQLTVGDVVRGPLQVFQGIEKVGNIVHVLSTTSHNGFPVIDEPPLSESPVLYGLILRAHVIELLKKKAFMPTPVPIGTDALNLFSAGDFLKRGSGNGDKIEDLQFTEEEMEMFLDLHPFTNASPYTVVETMSLAKALILFREVGLRHLMVTPKISGRSPVVGILTRHDFMPGHILGLHPMLTRSRWKRLRIRAPRIFKLF
ncbi:CHLORIDE CHANNEL PROTEIN [Salix purpurea]|uniref:Chloride channel protein n=1 Tax=Salix purpurea TaxID=77065 RepID=A0A9Q0T3Y9_SALPP|nr:CHLORIDE CHANNEL PROTEIN [Salix purpurea]